MAATKRPFQDLSNDSDPSPKRLKSDSGSSVFGGLFDWFKSPKPPFARGFDPTRYQHQVGGGYPQTDDTSAKSIAKKAALPNPSKPNRYEGQLEKLKPLSEYGLKNNKFGVPSPPFSVRKAIPPPTTQKRAPSSPFQNNAFNRSRMLQSQSNSSPSRIPVLATNSRRLAAPSTLETIDYSEEEQEAILRARGTSSAVRDSSARDAWEDERAASSIVIPSLNTDYRDSPSSYKRRAPMGSRKEAKKNVARVDKQLAEHQAMLRHSSLPSMSSAASGSGSGSAENNDPQATSDFLAYKAKSLAASVAIDEIFATSSLIREPLIRRTSSGLSNRNGKRKELTAEQAVNRTMRMAKETMATLIRKPDFPKLDEFRRIMEKLDDKKKTRKFKLTAAEEKLALQHLSTPSFVSTLPGAEVAHKDLRLLKGLQWLNDEIITFYAIMINARSLQIIEKGTKQEKEEFGDVFSFNSFFFSKLMQGGFDGVKRWTRKVDLFAKDRIIIPINLGNSHWVCSAINVREKRFEYYDSLGHQNSGVYKRLREYLKAEHLSKKKSELDLSEWTDYWDEDVPLQTNGSDCGIFTCQFMDTLARKGEGFDFSQTQMPYFRLRMVLDIHEKAIRREEYV